MNRPPSSGIPRLQSREDVNYRMKTLQHPTEIPWELLALQFGGEYTRLRAFKAAAIEHLRRVLAVYPQARVEETARGLKLLPSPPHVLDRPSRRRALSAQSSTLRTRRAQGPAAPRSGTPEGDPR